MYEDKIKAVGTKLAMLEFTDNETESVIAKGHLLTLERQHKILEKKLEEVQNSQVEIQEAKLKCSEEAEEVKAWSEDVEAKLVKFEQMVNSMEKITKEIKRKEMEEKKQAELKFTAQMKEKQFEKELRVEEEKYENKIHLEKKLEKNLKGMTPNKAANTKLPKLVITKFDGTHIDWLRFWNRIEAEIDTAQIPAVTKFSYLKEMLEKRVRVNVDGFPFNSEGYERAKNVLKTKYVKTSEIINTNVQAILALPHITGSQPVKIHNFYERLLSNLRALETLAKLREISGYVRMTINKLEGIGGDLVRTDGEWQEWEFPKLVLALRKWTERNPQKQDDRTMEKPPIGV